MSTSSHRRSPTGLEAKRKQISVEIPEAFQEFFHPAPIKIAYGGRGSGKSFNFAVMLVMRAYREPIRVLCAREFHNSMGESVHKELSAAISMLGLSPYFTITKTGIKSHTGAEFFFKGLHMNIDGIKSISNVDICWVEEAHTVSDDSWKILMPTIRKAEAEVWISFNPDSEDDPVYQRFVLNPMPGSIIKKVNYTDNPYFSETSLVGQLEHCKATAEKTGDWSEFLNIWEGHPKSISDAVIFKNRYKIEEFETPARVERFFFGADWGFAVDPTTLVRCFIVGRKLYVDQEAYGVGVELDAIPGFFANVPEATKWPICADNSRPETISKVAQSGLKVRAATKWPGSVEDGIAYLNGFEEIVIHPRCKHVAEEFKLYSYKVEKRTGDILPIPEDKHNHCIDALRYALDGYITKKEAAKTAHVPFMRR